MKKSKNLISILFAMSLLTIILVGCPYVSKVPFDEPSMNINNSLLGKWFTQKNPKETSTFYLTTKKSANVYSIIENRWNNNKKSFTQVNYEGWLSKLKNNQFLTVKTNNGYSFYKIISISSDQLKLDSLTSNIDEKFSNPSDLKNFILKHMHLSFFYNKTVTYYKK
ncbi:MAG: hypothetical protein OEV44_00605 [Spirochaetota bacterium]|nr:hypothetical protein [Spirochaetota bacterium]